jgi:hypothetical protein
LVSQQFRKRSSSLTDPDQSNSPTNDTIIDYLDRIEERLNAISFEIQTVRDDLQLIRQHFLQ